MLLGAQGPKGPAALRAKLEPLAIIFAAICWTERTRLQRSRVRAFSVCDFREFIACFADPQIMLEIRKEGDYRIPTWIIVGSTLGGLLLLALLSLALWKVEHTASHSSPLCTGPSSSPTLVRMYAHVQHLSSCCEKKTKQVCHSSGECGNLHTAQN